MSISTNMAEIINFGSYLRLSGFYGEKRHPGRFIRLIENGECIEVYAKKKRPFDYPRVRVKGKLYRYHRLLWQYLHGDIPDGMCVCHTCDNTRCINPSHLFLGSVSENFIDKAKKDRGGVTKLSPDQVHNIRRCDKNIKNTVLASLYNVTASAISRVRRGERRIYV